MGDLWLKIKIWTKVSLFVLLVTYVFAFVAKNISQQITFWYFPGKEPARLNVFLLTIYAFGGGIVGFLIVRTTYRTLRQIREMQGKARADRLEREVADMKSKAAMLRAKPVPGERAEAVAREETIEES